MLGSRKIVKGTIRSVDALGHGIVQADDGSKFPFLFSDSLVRNRIPKAGKRVTFSIRTVQDKVFAQNIAYEAERIASGIVDELA